MLDKDCVPVWKVCAGCEQRIAVLENDVTCPHCGTVTLQEE